MAIVNKKLTDPEIAAIWYHVFQGCDNWRKLYCMAAGVTDPEMIANVNKSTIYAWKNTPKIVTLIADVQRTKQAWIEEAENRGFEKGKGSTGESVRTNPDPVKFGPKSVDYTDPVNQARKLNELVNSADDPGEALDALKVIISTQKADREAARDNKTVRAYVPITCSDCPLYSRAKNKLSK